MELISLAKLTEWVHQFGYGVIFLGILLENAGIPLPGETIVLLGGWLAGSGELDFWGVWGWTVAGAIIGDSCGYWLGRWGGMNVLWRLAQLFRLPEQEVLKARDRFAQSADRAVFFGRFITFLRIFAGPLAGMAGMPYQRFLFFNIAGAITWGGVMVTLAYTAGRFVPLTVLAQYTLQFGILALLVALTWFALPWLKRSVSQNL